MNTLLCFYELCIFCFKKGYKILKEFFYHLSSVDFFITYHLSSLDFQLYILNPFFWIARYLAKLLSTPSFILFMNNDPFILISFSFSLPVSLLPFYLSSLTPPLSLPLSLSSSYLCFSPSLVLSFSFLTSSSHHRLSDPISF